MHIPTHDEVLGTIDAFLDRHPAIGPARFGRDATGEPGLVGRLRKGSTPTLKVLNRIKAYMDAKDAEVVAGGEHAAGDNSQAQRASRGSETSFSATSDLGSAAVPSGSVAAAAEGEGVSTLPGGLAA